MSINGKHKTDAEIAIEWQRRLIYRQSWQTCLNCGDWNKQMNGCERYRATPPADIIVNGCHEHFFDIPF